MTEVGIPRMEKGGEAAAWIFDGEYNPWVAPVTSEALDEIEIRLGALQARLKQKDTIIDRVRQVDTLMYLASLCNPRIINNAHEQDEAAPTSEESAEAYQAFAQGARLLAGYSAEELRISTDITLSHLDSPRIPILSAVEDMKARQLVSPWRADELGVIARLAAIRTRDPRQLPPLRQPRD